MEPNSTNFGRRRAAACIAALLAVLGIAAGVFFAHGSPAGEPVVARFHKVQRRAVRQVIAEEGDLESARGVEIRSQVEGRNRILWIIPNGEVVKKGDVVVRLDQAAIDEKLSLTRINFHLAKAALIKAKEVHSVAKIALHEYLEGTFVNELQAADAALTVARQAHVAAENMLQHVLNMHKKGYASRGRLESCQVDFLRTRLELAAAQTARSVLVDFARERMVRELEGNLKAAQADLVAAEWSLHLEKARVEHLEEQIRRCVIHAPKDGMILYSNRSDEGRGRDARLIEEGTEVRCTQPILEMPDYDHVQARISLHESIVDRVRPGMKATIRVHDDEAEGTVVEVANQPSPVGRYAFGLKEYATILRIDRVRDGQPLRPGMSASVEIEVDEVEDALAIPLAGLVELGEDYFCYVRTPEGIEKRPISIGLADGKVVEVKDGLEPGEEIVIDPRSTLADCRRDIEELASHCETGPGLLATGSSPAEPADAEPASHVGEPEPATIGR